MGEPRNLDVSGQYVRVSNIFMVMVSERCVRMVLGTTLMINLNVSLKPFVPVRIINAESRPATKPLILKQPFGVVGAIVEKTCEPEIKMVKPPVTREESTQYVVLSCVKTVTESTRLRLNRQFVESFATVMRNVVSQFGDDDVTVTL